VEPSRTQETYDRLAGFWSGASIDPANGIAQHQRAIRFLREKRTAIDVGCGSSGRIIGLLVSAGFATEGLDISSEMIRLAGEQHPEVVFHHQDVCVWEPPHRYDLISAWDSIWHAPLAEHESILRKLCGALEPGGVLIFTSGGVDAPEAGESAFMGETLYHAALGIPALLRITMEEGCVCRHLEYDQHPERHLYLIVQKS